MSIAAIFASSSSAETFSQLNPYTMFEFKLPDAAVIDKNCSASLGIYRIPLFSAFGVADCRIISSSRYSPLQMYSKFVGAPAIFCKRRLNRKETYSLKRVLDEIGIWHVWTYGQHY